MSTTPPILPFFTGDQAPEVKPVEWLVQDFLARGAGTILFGQPGVSKTAHAAHLVACLCTGRNFAGMRVYGRYRVLYLDLDAGWNWTGPLFRAAFRGVGIEGLPESFAYWSPISLEINGDALDTSLEFIGPALAESAKAHRADLVVVDSLGQFIAGDSDKAQDVSMALRGGLNPIRALGAAVLVIDHATKAARIAGATVPTPAGSQQKRAWARVTVALEAEEREGNKITRWTVDKSNTKHFEPFLTYLDFWSDSGGQLYSLALERLGEAGPRSTAEPSGNTKAVAEIITRLSRGDARRKEFPYGGTYDRALKELLESGQITQPDRGIYRLAHFFTTPTPSSEVVKKNPPPNFTVEKVGETENLTDEEARARAWRIAEQLPDPGAWRIRLNREGAKAARELLAQHPELVPELVGG